MSSADVHLLSVEILGYEHAHTTTNKAKNHEYGQCYNTCQEHWRLRVEHFDGVTFIFRKSVSSFSCLEFKTKYKTERYPHK